MKFLIDEISLSLKISINKNIFQKSYRYFNWRANNNFLSDDRDYGNFNALSIL